MEKTDKKPAPVETVLERPDLHHIQWYNSEGMPTGLDGVWLVKGNDKIVVKASNLSRNPDFKVGFRKKGRPAGPQYTGPIDDEMMANILIYGG